MQRLTNKQQLKVTAAEAWSNQNLQGQESNCRARSLAYQSYLVIFAHKHLISIFIASLCVHTVYMCMPCTRKDICETPQHLIQKTYILKQNC